MLYLYSKKVLKCNQNGTEPNFKEFEKLVNNRLKGSLTQLVQSATLTG